MKWELGSSIREGDGRNLTCTLPCLSFSTVCKQLFREPWTAADHPTELAERKNTRRRNGDDPRPPLPPLHHLRLPPPTAGVGAERRRCTGAKVGKWNASIHRKISLIIGLYSVSPPDEKTQKKRRRHSSSSSSSSSSTPSSSSSSSSSSDEKKKSEAKKKKKKKQQLKKKKAKLKKQIKKEKKKLKKKEKKMKKKAEMKQSPAEKPPSYLEVWQTEEGAVELGPGRTSHTTPHFTSVDQLVTQSLTQQNNCGFYNQEWDLFRSLWNIRTY